MLNRHFSISSLIHRNLREDNNYFNDGLYIFRVLWIGTHDIALNEAHDSVSDTKDK